jgi:ribonuclease D
VTENFQFIDSDQAVDEVYDRLTQSTVLAVDTEFVRERTFYPKAGLIQVANDDSVYLIDPLSCDIGPFLEILENPIIKKIMHSVSEDMDVFYALGCYQVQFIFDTQIAATWLGSGLSLSLQNLVQKHTNLILEKSETRTNWLARPLSAAQLAYAAEDVVHLIDIADEQQALLQALSIQDQFREDCQIACERDESDHETDYLLYGRAHNFTEQELCRFQRLIAWRERVARRDDKPRPHLLKDADIQTIAKECTKPRDLKKVDLHPVFRRRYSDELIALLFERPLSSVAPVFRLQDLKGGKEMLNALRSQLPKLAEKQGMPVETMPSKRILEQILLHHAIDYYPAPKQWRGWRKALIEPMILELQNQWPLSPRK